MQDSTSFLVGDWRVDPLRLVMVEAGGMEHSLTPRAMAVLVELAKARGEVVRKYDLMQAVWGKAEVSDGALFQAIFEIRQVVGDASKGARFIETIRGVGFRLLPPVRDDTPKESSPERRPRSMKRGWGLAAALAVVLVLVLGGVLRSGPGKETTIPVLADKSIAVLPFSDLGGFGTDRYFIDGIHDDLLTQISTISDLRVLSRSSVMPFRDSDESESAIGEALGVGVILKGGVQRAGEQVRVNVQLIDVASDTNLWARSYTRDLSAANVFAIQRDITMDVAESLQTILSREDEARLARVPTTNLEALGAYFRAMEANSIGTDEGFRRGVILLERAVELDPDFAEAHARLAMTLLLQVYFSSLPIEAQVRAAEPHIERALALAPRLSAAQVALGQWHEVQRDQGPAEAAYRKALELNANSVLALRSYGLFLNWVLGQPREAIPYFERALRLAPGSTGIRQQFAEALLAAGDLERGEATIRGVLADNPNNALALRVLGTYLVWHRGRTAEGIEALLASMRADPGNQSTAVFMVYAFETLGDRDRVRAWLEHAISIAPNSKDVPAFRALIAENEGDLEGATEAMARVSRDSDLYIDLQLHLAWNSHVLGETARALAHILDVHPEFLDEPPDIERLHLGEAAYAAYFLSLLGEQAEADRLARATLDAADQLPATGRFGRYWWPAVAQLALGDVAAATDSLWAFLDEGPFDASLVDSAVWAPLREEEQYLSLREEVRRRIAEERKKLAERGLSPLLTPTEARRTLGHVSVLPGGAGATQ